ncbi:MAG TPA: NAD-dependent epimerase/dehydratase family protein [Egibacteraceae bacterium]|nr:NAD-dependent epimerase/dehydratase family protein [Egibacteraceae bacterium]
MRIAITGATGNVGTTLISALAEEAEVESIVGIARRRPEWAAPKTTWVTADVERDDLTEHFTGADAVVHLAWLFHPMRNSRITWDANVLGSIRVFRAAANAGASTLVYASSVGAYSPGPQHEAVDETWPTHGWPIAAYSREKAYVERVLDTFEHEHPDIRVVRMRPGFIFKRESASQQRRMFAGPLAPNRLLRPDRIPVVPDFPGLRFQALHSADAAQAYRLALLREVRGAFNLAAEPVVDAGVLAEIFDARTVQMPLPAVRAAVTTLFRLHAIPVEPALLDVLVRVPLLDTSRARDELGWHPEHNSVFALLDVFTGMREGAGLPTPPLDPDTSGRLRSHEIATGVGEQA